MFYSFKTLEIITGKDFGLGYLKYFYPDTKEIIRKTKSYKTNLSLGYVIYCNFKSGEGPVVLNSLSEYVLSLVDGEKSFEQIYTILQKDKNFSDKLNNFKNLFVSLKDKKINTKDIFTALKSGSIVFSKSDLQNFFSVLLAVGIVKFSSKRETPPIKKNTLVSWIHITGGCNLACDYCYVKKDQKEMTEDTGKRIIDKLFFTARANNFKIIDIKFAGGEPLLKFKLILNLADYALQKSRKEKISVNFFLLTNGTLINQENIDELKKRNFRASVSLDGIGKWHDLQAKYPNGDGSFDKVGKAIKLMIKNDYPPTIICVITSKNIGGIPELTKYLLERKLYFYFRFMRKSSIENSNKEPTPRDLISTMKQVYSVLQKDLPSDHILISLITNDFPRFIKTKYYGCGVGENYVVIEPTGEIVPCIMDLGNREEYIGHIDEEDDLLKIITRPESKKKNPLLENRKSCKKCECWGVCVGGCPVNAYNNYGSYSERCPYCEVYKSLLPEAMRLIGQVLLKKNKII